MKKISYLLIAWAFTITAAQAETVAEKIKSLNTQIAEMAPALEAAKASGDAAFLKEISEVVENLQKERAQLGVAQPAPAANGTTSAHAAATIGTAPVAAKIDSTDAALKAEVSAAAAQQKTEFETPRTQPEIISNEIQAEFLKLDDKNKRAIATYLIDLALMNYFQDTTQAAQEKLQKASNKKTHDALYDEWESIKDKALIFGIRLPKEKVAFGKELTPLVNRIELALSHVAEIGEPLYNALFKDLGITELAKAIGYRYKNKDQIYVAFVSRNPGEKAKIEEALKVHKLSPQQLKWLGLQHGMIVLAKNKNNKYSSVEKIMGKQMFDRAMKPNALFGIKKAPEDLDFAILDELRVELLGDKAIFPVAAEKVYVVRLAPCGADDNTVKFSQAPTKFCVQEVDKSEI